MNKTLLNNIKKGLFYLSLSFLILFYYCYSFAYAKVQSIEESNWILETYTQNSFEMKSQNIDSDYINDFHMRLDNNSLYINNEKYEVTKGVADNVYSLLSRELQSSYTKESHNNYIYEPFILNSGKVNYLQINTPVDPVLSQLLLPEQRLIYRDNTILFITKGLLMIYNKPADSQDFKRASDNFPSLPLPINMHIIYYFTLDNEFKYRDKNSRRFSFFLDLVDNKNLLTQINPYIDNISGIKLPILNKTIKPMLIYAESEAGESINYLYLFSDKLDLLDKLTLRDYLSPARDATSDPTGYINFNIDKNYFIERWQRFDDETIEIEHYQVTEQGRFQEAPVTSSCYSEFSPKNKEIHSPDSILLTSYQANNYLRFDYGESEMTESIEKKFDDNPLTITLDPTNQKLCLNYQRSYDVLFSKTDSRQFFGDDELYQQQVNHFNNYGIDISEKVDVVSFDKIENTPLALFLMNGNQAIYMNDTLFLVGKDYFSAYKQPTKSKLIADYDYLEAITEQDE